MGSPSGILIDLPRSDSDERNTRLRHLGGAVAGSRLLRRLCRQGSSVVVSRGKALGLSVGIAIMDLDWACILLDKRFSVCAYPQRCNDDDEDGNDNGSGHMGHRQQSTKRGSGIFLVLY